MFNNSLNARHKKAPLGNPREALRPWTYERSTLTEPRCHMQRAGAILLPDETLFSCVVAIYLPLGPSSRSVDAREDDLTDAVSVSAKKSERRFLLRR